MATILIVDDRASNREFLVTLLGYSGHSLLEAGDGAEGLVVAQIERPDLVIADILMPTMDGYEFVRQLRADPMLADTRVLFYTAQYHEPEAIRLAEACGVFAVLTKPCEPEEVLRTVEAALGQARQTSSEPAADGFDRQHLHLLTDKLSQKSDELGRTNERLKAMIDLGLQLGSERDPGQLVQTCCDAAREIIGGRYAVVGITNGVDSPYRYFLTSGMDVGMAGRTGYPAPLAGFLSSVLAAGRCFRVANHSGLVAAGVPLSFPPAHALLAAPILSPTRVYGWLCLLDKFGAEGFTDEDERLAGMIGAQVGRVYENGSLYDDLLRHTSKLAEEVAERKRSEAALRESEERFRGAFEHSGVAMVISDSDNRFVRVNRAFAQLFGYAPSEMLGMTMANVAHPDDLDASYASRDRLLTGQEQFLQMEKRYLRRDGTLFWSLTNVSLVRDPDGRPLLYVAQVQDITQRKRAEELQSVQHSVVSILASSVDLREAAPRLLHAVCETTGWNLGSLWVVDRPTNVLTCVDLWYARESSVEEFENLTRRYTFAPGVGLPGHVWEAREPTWIVDVSKDPNFHRATPAATAGFRSGFGFPIQFGSEVLGVAEFFSRVSRQPDEELLRIFANLGSQIGQFIERKRVEVGLRLFRALIDQTTDGVEVIDPETGHFLDMNERACVMHGYTREEYLRLGVPDVDQNLARQPWREAIEAHRRVGSERFESVHRRKNGSTFPVEANYNFIRLDGHFLVAVVRDITERRLLEEQFRQSQKMEAVGRLAGGVAHDFNNLLTVITGYGEMVLASLPVANPMSELIREIVNAGERAAGLTRQLLSFSRKAIIEPKVLDLRGVVADVERMLRRILGEDIQLAVDASQEIGLVHADPGQIEQVILNLVVNARDAMPRGGRLSIRLRNVELDQTYCRLHPEARPGPHVLLSVADSGCGMDAATLVQIFEPFFSSKGEHGTGLGLATVQGIVLQAGGHVAVYSEIDRGTTFDVCLPRVEGAEPTSKSRHGPSSMVRGSETILLVEDEESVRSLSRQILETCGYKVHDVRNGVEAIQFVGQYQGRIDLVVTDVVMPLMGGREVAERLKHLCPDAKILFVSGYTDDAVVRHGVREVEVALLQKPFSPIALSAKVRELLDQVEVPRSVGKMQQRAAREPLQP